MNADAVDQYWDLRRFCFHYSDTSKRFFGVFLVDPKPVFHYQKAQEMLCFFAVPSRMIL